MMVDLIEEDTPFDSPATSESFPAQAPTTTAFPEKEMSAVSPQ
jgi:hypothetical protein